MKMPEEHFDDKERDWGKIQSLILEIIEEAGFDPYEIIDVRIYLDLMHIEVTADIIFEHEKYGNVIFNKTVKGPGHV